MNSKDGAYFSGEFVRALESPLAEGVAYLTRRAIRVYVVWGGGEPSDVFKGTNGVTYDTSGRVWGTGGAPHEDDITHYVREAGCFCRCGYRCGGPGVCALSAMDCLATHDGKHFVRDCGHEFAGLVDVGGGSYSAVCVWCGESAMTHDCRVGP